MTSVLGEIAVLRGQNPIVIDYHNNNRYRLIAQEANGSKTAYYFSTPIYNIKDRKLIDMKFKRNGDSVLYAIGSNAEISVARNILMENAEGCCSIELKTMPTLVTDKLLLSGNNQIETTCNGIAFKCPVKGTDRFDFIIEVGEPDLNIRANDKYFALMKETFRPFVVFSCIGSTDHFGNVIAPAVINYQKLTDNKFQLTVSTASPFAQYVLFEGNLYENKLIQDTTVESLNPNVNNAFGGTGFIGNSCSFGEQWLYSRPDFARMPEILDKQIQSIKFHLPKLNQGNVDLSAFKVSARFCSFGSTWDNKISGGALIADSKTTNGYQNLDITSLLVDPRTMTLAGSEGLILKSKVKDSGFSAIATGDSYYTPQILEVNYR